jgi:hypothetical protein
MAAALRDPSLAAEIHPEHGNRTQGSEFSTSSIQSMAAPLRDLEFSTFSIQSMAAALRDLSLAPAPS